MTRSAATEPHYPHRYTVLEPATFRDGIRLAHVTYEKRDAYAERRCVAIVEFETQSEACATRDTLAEGKV